MVFEYSVCNSVNADFGYWWPFPLALDHGNAPIHL